ALRTLRILCVLCVLNYSGSIITPLLHKFTLFFILLNFSLLQGQVFKTQKEALEQAFPDGQNISRKVVFLTEKQIRQIQKLAKARVESKLIVYYVGSVADSVTGYAFFETDIVRTKPATFMVVIRPDSSIKFVTILAFYEPLDYLPIPRWLNLFRGKRLNANLWMKRDIHNITGATLSVQAITLGVRKMLAIYQVAIPKEKAR
ncbi:MAG: hypothetical protein ACE5HX_13230, partial [bacterium]